jgi:hypothetical protein
MKVKRKSWHYKISNFGDSFEKSNDNLCRYFWRLIGKCALVVFGTLGGIFLTIAFFASPYWISVTIIVLWVCSSVILPVLAVWFLREKLGKSPEMPYGNLVVEYMKAKKEKVCPIIEYTD